MKKSWILWLMLLFCSSVQSQNYFDISAGYTHIRQDAWNETIQMYNFSRFWHTEALPDLRRAGQYGIGYSGILASGFFFSPSLSYSAFKSEANQVNSSTFVRLRWINGSLNFDVFPLEFGKDSVSANWRPFFRFGGGASLLMPRVFFDDSLSTLSGEAYQPMVWPFYYTLGVGVRYNFSPKLGLMLSANYQRYPQIELTDFSYALHGSKLVNLRDNTPVAHWNFSLSFCLRLNGEPDEPEAEKKKVKFKKKRR